MRKLFYFTTLLFCAMVFACSSDSDEVVKPPVIPYDPSDSLLGWHSSGIFLGKFNVAFCEGDKELGRGWMDNDGWITFNYVPTDTIISRILAEKSGAYTFMSGGIWGGEVFGYFTGASSEKADSFKMKPHPYNSRMSLVPGTYNNVNVLITAIYDESDIFYAKETDSWEGSIKIKGLSVYEMGGNEVSRIECSPSYTLNFHSLGRFY